MNRIYYPACRYLALAIFASLTISAEATNLHRPTIGPIPDQRVQTNQSFATLRVPVFDFENSPNLNVTATVYNYSSSSWYSGTPVFTNQNDGTWLLTFPSEPTTSGSATVLVTVTDGTFNTYTSFTLLKYNYGSAPPDLGGVASQTIPKGGTYNSSFFINDPDSGTTTYSVNAVATYVSVTGFITSGPTVTHSTLGGNSVSVGTANTNGYALITISAQDNSGNTNITSFVVDSRPLTYSSPITIAYGTPANSFLAASPSNPTPVFYLKVANATISNVVLTATSSNPAVVANSASNFHFSSVASDGTASLTVTNTGNAGATTITVAATDGAFVAHTQFLYVLENPNEASAMFGRSTGLYTISSPDSFRYYIPTFANPTGAKYPLYDGNVSAEPWASGYVLRIPWSDMERQPNMYDFSVIRSLLDSSFTPVNASVTPNRLPAGQHLSILIQGEPADLDMNPGSDSWCDDTNGLPCVNRPVPWNQALRTRFKQLIAAMAASPVGIGTLAGNTALVTLDPSLPGATNGIRDPGPGTGETLATLNTSFTRQKLLASIEDYLRPLQDYFPGKHIQIGFWNLASDNIATPPLTEYIRSALVGEFNGIERPHIGFWLDDLAATRATVGLDYVALDGSGNPSPAYTPAPASSGVGSVLAESENAEWTGFQDLGIWRTPFNIGQLQKLLNSSPNDGFEGGYNVYRSLYAEVYLSDVQPPDPTPPLWTLGLQSWHDYMAYRAPLIPVQAPAGVAVSPNSTSSNHISWYPVDNAVTYTVKRVQLYPSGGIDQQFTPTSNTYYDDTVTSGNQYAYQVETNGSNGNSSYSPFVTTFLSTALYDGYVSQNNANNTNNTSTGIRAGQATATNQVKGVVSFDDSTLPTGATILSALLREKQGTDDSGFAALGPCFVEIKDGAFYNNDINLTKDDFGAAADGLLLDNLPSAGLNGWAPVRVDSDTLGFINPSGTTQFRQSFMSTSQVSNVGWYPGETSIESRPQLQIRYTTP